MGDKSAIEWTDASWNCLRGCSRVSAGCMNCYAEAVAFRFSAPGMPYEGLARTVGQHGGRWTGEVRFVKEALALPLRWTRPRRIFVNSMSDLFHEKVSDDRIAAIFGVMMMAPWHTFQVLTKRPERMRDWLAWIADAGDGPITRCYLEAQDVIGLINIPNRRVYDESLRWPLPNVWLGVSVEDQATADERIPLLLQTPAAVRWVSYEPALGPVDFSHYLDVTQEIGPGGLDWIVVGGESGGGARPFDLAWARETVDQCRAAGVPVFVKQLGASAFDSDLTASGRSETLTLRDRKGGDMAEWPEDLRVREYPR